MRNVIYLIITAFAIAMLASCGGNSGSVKSSLPSNEYMGNLPAILETHHKTDSIIDLEYENNAQNIKSEKDIKKYEEYKEKRELKSAENDTKRDNAIAKEKEKLVGKVLPVESLDPRFEVVELKIADVDYGGVSIEGTIKTTGTVRKVGLQFVVYYDVKNENGLTIDTGIIYVKDADDLRRPELPDGTELPINAYLSIYKNNFEDFSKFAKIVFIEKD